MKRGLILILLLASLTALTVSVRFYAKINRFYHVLTLFGPDVIQHNFRNMGTIFAFRTVPRTGPIYELPEAFRPLPATYQWNDQKHDLVDWLDRTETTGMIVLKDGQIVFQEYYRGNDGNSHTISWSVTKSFVSALIGFAVQDGVIKSLDEPVTYYVPTLKTSGYNNVRIKDVLQMSSGIEFNEDYDDFHSDINRMGRTIALGTSIDDFVVSLSNARKPGTYNHYVSMDTQVIAMVLTRATGKNLSDYMKEKLWSRLGAELDAYWLTDDKGVELAFGGLNSILRDYARFGQFYLDAGRNWQGEQLLPESWIKASVTPDAPHLMPGKHAASGSSFGYAYQWWLPEKTTNEEDYLAMGIYGQFLYINPKHRVVIAKSSAYSDPDAMKNESIAVFRHIARNI
ncbi:MAG: serine hydrolase [Endozoicomonadaceae bacterium]|nr:serine hydrolase [Endozoicomonadaceae bacterium]